MVVVVVVVVVVVGHCVDLVGSTAGVIRARARTHTHTNARTWPMMGMWWGRTPYLTWRKPSHVIMVRIRSLSPLPPTRMMTNMLILFIISIKN